MTAAYAADTNYNAASGASGTFTITKATPTFGTMSFSPTSEAYGTSQIVTISDTLIYGGATAPTGAVTFTLNGTPYTATCTGASSPRTCTYAVSAATIAALTTQGYTVTAAYAADANYNAASGVSGTFTITKATPTFGTMSFSPAASEAYGSSQIVTISDTLILRRPNRTNRRSHFHAERNILRSHMHRRRKPANLYLCGSGGNHRCTHRHRATR